MPSRRSSSPSASPSGAGSRASTWLAPSTRVTSPPRRRTAWAISAPTGPPPRIRSRRGTSFMPVTSRLVHTPSSSRRPGTGGITGSAPLARIDVPGGVPRAVHLDHAGPGQPAGTAQEVDPVVRQPALLPGVGVVRDHEVPPGQRGRHVHLGVARGLPRPVHRLAGPQQRLGRDAGVVRALAAGQLALHDGDPQPALGQLARAVLAGRPGAQHDHVVVVVAHVSAPAAGW